MNESKKNDPFNYISISVRNLVEFVLRSGDLDNRHSGREADAMQEGARLHKKLQKKMKGDYQAEVTLKLNVETKYDDEDFLLEIEGRADGIFSVNYNEIENNQSLDNNASGTNDDNKFKQISLEESENISECDLEKIDDNISKGNESSTVYIDEIKCMYADVTAITEPYEIHLAQAKCYAYIYAMTKDYKEDLIGVRLTYCNIETEIVNQIYKTFTIEELENWFAKLTTEYSKWAAWQIKWNRLRNDSIKAVSFPFTYRPGQKELVASVYHSLVRSKLLFIEAPTGVGKTISTVFPTVQAMAQEKLVKIFYLTAKTITRTVAEETFDHLVNAGMKLKVVTLVAKEKICILEKPDCNPVSCERAKGHYDRVNDAVYDMLISEERVDRDKIVFYANKHNVCPFEMSLDLTLWVDAIICDYNYVFDPNVYLRRFFQEEKKNDYAFLIDEAHNLVERARQMYSAELIKEDFLKVKRYVQGKDLTKNNQLEISNDNDSVGNETQDELPNLPERIDRFNKRLNSDKELKQLVKVLDKCNKLLLEYKHECEEFEIWEEETDLYFEIIRLIGAFDNFFKESREIDNKDEVQLFYFNLKHYVFIHDQMDDDYMIYTDYLHDNSFRLKLMCMDPSRNLKNCLSRGRSAVFFSATLLPINYYKEQLGGNAEDYAIYAPSPFDTKNRLLLIGKDVSTKYTRRSADEYNKIYEYIKAFVSAKVGNYMVFFPSYSMMNEIFLISQEDEFEGIVCQEKDMSEEAKERFLEEFVDEPNSSRIGFCVMGGIFSEGIDLKSNRLIGTVIVGTGLPQVCNEREMFRGFFDRKNGQGFEYAYLYQGMNKVLQAAGRVIRTDLDRGAILLLDERFTFSQYKKLFPREWEGYKLVNCDSMSSELEKFWNY